MTRDGDQDGDRPQVEVVVGRIGKPHGIRGEVTIEVRTDEPDRRLAPGAVLLTQPPAGSAFRQPTLEVLATRRHQATLLARFAELADRTAAEAARGTLLLTRVDAEERPEDPEEFYDHQLVGLQVVDPDRRVIGTVTGVVHGAQDLLQVRSTDGRATLVPFVSALVPEVDLAAGVVVVADRPGLVAPFPDDA